MKKTEKEHAGDYEITQSCVIGKKRFVIGCCESKPQPYLIANHRTKLDGMFGEYYDVGVSADYTEILAAYIQRQKDELDVILQERRQRGSDGIPYTAADCLPDMDKQDLTRQIVVMKTESLNPEFRVKEEQLFYPLSGFGCAPNSRGGKVFGRDCYTGDPCYIRRENIAGVLKPELVPGWAADHARAFAKAEQAKAQMTAKRTEER